MEKLDEHVKRHFQKILEGDDLTPSMYVNDASKLFNTTVARATERIGLSQGYRQILFHLAHNDGITQLQLVKLTHLTAPTISVALVKMEKDGLVRRETDERDMRQVRVHLTEKGRDQDDFVRSKCRETEEIMLKGISDKERKELCRIMKKVVINLMENC